MLPSTGYFKGLSCPFYDSGLCERPYCHFRHVKKDAHSLVGDGIENGTILQQLVSEAVKKVLQQSDSSNTFQAEDQSVTKEVPPLTLCKATYNPTPIAELKKITNLESPELIDENEQRRKHIPVPYTPRKPPTLSVVRSVDNISEFKPFGYLPPAQYSPGSKDTPKLDPYLPQGNVECKEKYIPGAEVELQEYKPIENKTNSVKYTPSDNKSSRKKILEYEPIKVSSKNSSVIYQPTPKSLAPCFSSDEEEPEVKKKKLSTELNDFDDLGAEFDMLGEILDEEKTKEETKPIEEIKSSNKEPTKKEKKSSSLQRDGKKDRRKNDKDNNDKNKKSSHSNSHEPKSSEKRHHKSSTKEKHKEKDEKKDQSSKDRTKESDRKKHSSSKSSDKSSKCSDKNSSRHSSKDNPKKKHEDKRTCSDKTSHKSLKEKHKHSKHKIEAVEQESSLPDCVDDLDHNDAEEIIEDISESDEESIALECKRIFEEYVPEAKPNLNTSVPEDQPMLEESYEYIPTKKRISHTADKEIKVIHKPPVKPDFKVSAAQKMAERLAKVKEYHAAKQAQNAFERLKAEAPAPVPIAAPQTNGKVRIAHVPYASTLLNAKKNISYKVETVVSQPSTSSQTISQTVKKGIQRVAHMPNDKFIDRPGVLEPLASKIPANIRSTYLNMMIDECLKIYLSATDAYARAQHEELNTSKKCKTIQIYKNSAVLAVSRLRKELLECNGVKKSGIDCSQLQKLPVSGAWSIQNKNQKSYENPNEYKGAQLYENIKKWILTEEQLQENGFPRLHPNKERGKAKIYAERKQNPPRGHYRTCCRCNKEFTVDKKGFPSVKEECVYHPNRKYRYRGEVKYQCCSQDGMSDGCCVAASHVYEYVDYENLKGFVKTMPPEKHMDDYGVYALDCEMCYTTHGLDLTRITVINSSCQVVYETLINPLHPITDYNTKFSGITEEQMSSVKTTLLDVQATLLTMFNSKTILIGHSLESDFKALKLIHDTVIDTSVLFPHKMGPPYKRALRNLSSEYLKKIIQNSVDGHNSAEDALACMELIHFKLKEDLKSR